MSTTGEVQIETVAAQHINKAHAEFISIGKKTQASLLSQINKAREVGVLLLAEKAKCKHGEWERKFKTAKGKSKTAFTFDFDYNAGRNYIRVAKALPEPIESLPDGIRVLTDIYRNMGALPDPEGTEGGERPPTDFFLTFTKATNVFEKSFNRIQALNPVIDWPVEQREAVKARLEPLVKLYEALTGGEVHPGKESIGQA